MTNGTERRAYARIHLRAYACDKICTLNIDNRNIQACLVDLSAGGARLKLAQPLDGPKDQPLIFTLENVPHKGLLSNVPSTVRWRNGSELGIQFNAALDVGVGTLQKFVS